jgi:hypothetical protein
MGIHLHTRMVGLSSGFSRGRDFIGGEGVCAFFWSMNSHMFTVFSLVSRKEVEIGDDVRISRRIVKCFTMVHFDMSFHMAFIWKHEHVLMVKGFCSCYSYSYSSVYHVRLSEKELLWNTCMFMPGYSHNQSSNPLSRNTGTAVKSSFITITFLVQCK